MKNLRMLGFAILVLSAAVGVASAQSWQPLTNQPSFTAGAALLLTDGTVMVHHEGPDNGYSEWYKLTPDINGSYVNGTWTQMASLAVELRAALFCLGGTARRPIDCRRRRTEFCKLCLDEHGRHLRPACRTCGRR